ncbi:hypothetical protein F2P81_015856 [Scophthalmus maximus]|uniref:Uncharacterized protein n=1 Tax=Scophthalmus maximus TaxID=52904 RepID=A0A6A4SJL5_SCOMX|nr:hypothetical protein F2P81_015856 [Scophthalmus maximus]
MRNREDVEKTRRKKRRKKKKKSVSCVLLTAVVWIPRSSAQLLLRRRFKKVIDPVTSGPGRRGQSIASCSNSESQRTTTDDELQPSTTGFVSSVMWTR